MSAGGSVVGTTVFGLNAKLAVAAKTGAHLAISGFRATDMLDLTTFKFSAAEKLSFAGSKTGTSGTLTIIDGTVRATVLLFGQYTAAGFHLGDDGLGGTAITFSTPGHSAQVELGAGHQ